MTCIHHPNHYYPGNDQPEVSSLRRNVPGPIPGSHSSAVVEGGGAISQRMPWLMVKIFQHLCVNYWLSYFFLGGWLYSYTMFRLFYKTKSCYRFLFFCLNVFICFAIRF